MIEATKSQVDGKWRAWALVERSRLGEVTPQELAAGAPDLPRWVVVATAYTQREAIREGLRVAKELTPQVKDAA